MNIDIQTVVVILIVVPSVAYAAWSVMPNALRAATARGLLHASWPARIDAWLRKAAAGTSGCGCSGCDNNPAKAVSGKGQHDAAPVHVIRIHPRKR